MRVRLQDRGIGCRAVSQIVDPSAPSRLRDRHDIIPMVRKVLLCGDKNTAVRIPTEITHHQGNDVQSLLFSQQGLGVDVSLDCYFGIRHHPRDAVVIRHLAHSLQQSPLSHELKERTPWLSLKRQSCQIVERRDTTIGPHQDATRVILSRSQDGDHVRALRAKEHDIIRVRVIANWLRPIASSGAIGVERPPGRMSTS